MFIATPIGMLLAVLLDRTSAARASTRRVFYLPVVLSLAVIGIIWRLQYAPEQGLINNVLGRTANKNLIDWLGDPSLNLWAALVATSWRHVGYIMVLYLAGLKAFDPTLREAAKVDGANERQTFFRVVFPVMMPINIVIVVITTIEALRAFDIAYIINRGKNGLELLSTLITNNAHQRVEPARASARRSPSSCCDLARPIIAFLTRMMREDDDDRGDRPGRGGERGRQRASGCRHRALRVPHVDGARVAAPAGLGDLHGPAAVLRHAARTVTSRCRAPHPRQLPQRLDPGRVRAALPRAR